MSVSERQLLNVIFDSASAPDEKHKAVEVLKKVTRLDRDKLAAKFSAPVPQVKKTVNQIIVGDPKDKKKILELEARVKELEEKPIFMDIAGRIIWFGIIGLFIYSCAKR